MTLLDFLDDADQGRGDLQSVSGLSFLMSVDGIGPVKATKIAENYRYLAALREASAEQLSDIAGRSSSELERHRWNEINPIVLPDGVRAISKFDDGWPKSLQNLRSAPAIIYVVGTVPDIPCLAVVGTRQPTDFGFRVVETVVEEAAHRGWGIVSGLALGIDTKAHEMALKYKTPTWAILGGGVDVPTPAANRELAEAIVNAGGGLISEQIPGSEPNPQRLVARNRLQVAFSEIVVAAQAGIPSGTLHTVRFALEQNKRLVVPKPTGTWAGEKSSTANMALTDPLGCSPTILNAGSSLAKVLLARRPIADVVLSSDDIDAIWR